MVERFYRASDVCKLLGISRATLYRKIDRDEIDKPLKDGCRMALWPESSIAKYQARLKSQHLQA